MSNNFYSRLSIQGMRKNGKIYLPYILTSVGIAMMYYIVSYLTYSKSVYNMKGGPEMQMILSWGTGIIAVFAVIFLFYTNSFVIRRRKREFGLYNILGMGKRHIARVLIWEVLLTYIISVGAGLGFGISLSKLAELVSAKVLGESASLGFTIEKQAVINTLVLFAVVFALILLNSLRQIHLTKPIELLHSDQTGEKPPKARWFFAVVGMLLLAAAYYISCTIKDPMEALVMFFVAAAMVVMATYILFMVGSVVLCRILQKNKRYYYKTNHFVSVSSMMYRMKRNGASLASICILSTMVLVMISSTLCLYVGEEDVLRERCPRNYGITYNFSEGLSNENEAHVEEYKTLVSEIVSEHNLTEENILEYRGMSVAALLNGNMLSFDRAEIDTVQSIDKLVNLIVMPIDDYNRLMNKSDVLADDGEIILYSDKAFNYDTLNIEGYGELRVKNQAQEVIPEFKASLSFTNIYIFVSPEQINGIFNYQKSVYNEQASRMSYYYGFDLDCSDDEQIDIMNEIFKKHRDQEHSKTVFGWSIENIASKRQDFYGMFGSLLLLGIMLSIVFMIACVLIMYYKQISEGYEDAGRFEIMQKVGMTRREIRKSINSQILTVFAAPLIMAGMHLVFVFPMMSQLLKAFQFCNTGLLIGVTAISFVIFGIAYALVYKITSRSYYKIVSK